MIVTTALRTLRSRRLFGDVLRQPVARVGLLIMIALLTILIFAPLFLTYAPNDIAPRETLQAPSMAHLMGTDNLGRDVLTRFVYGGRVSLFVGISASFAGGTIGILLGLLSGFYGRWVDSAISWFVEVLLAFPGVLLALVVVAILGPGIINIVVAVAVSFVPSFTRVTRASVMQVREQDYIEAAYTLGSPTWRILLYHIFPNVLSPILALVTLGIGVAMLEGASLSFIGLGIQPPNPEWGAMLNAGRTFIGQAWWVTVFPGVGIFLTTLAINLIGNAITDAIDPGYRARTQR